MSQQRQNILSVVVALVSIIATTVGSTWYLAERIGALDTRIAVVEVLFAQHARSGTPQAGNP